MQAPKGYRFEVVTQRADGRRMLVSRHHQRSCAERRLIRIPLMPGQSVVILDEGWPVRLSRRPAPGETPEIPF